MSGVIRVRVILEVLVVVVVSVALLVQVDLVQNLHYIIITLKITSSISTS
jgi:hypothetical protein